MDHPRILAVIPARAGSKAVKLKNIAPVADKPLIGYTIEQALAASSVLRVIVTTDSEEIAEVARSFGAEVPFLRPKELAQDDTPGILPIIHATRWLEVYKQDIMDFILCLQPTSPLRSAEDIDQAVRIAVENEADSVISVTPVDHHPFWMKLLDDNGRMTDFMAMQNNAVRRQDLPPVYALNGAIYLARREVLLLRETWYTDRTWGYIMPKDRSLDIDTPWDLYLANLLLKR